MWFVTFSLGLDIGQVRAQNHQPAQTAVSKPRPISAQNLCRLCGFAGYSVGYWRVELTTEKKQKLADR